ncbi:MAG: hypothetical protein H0W78_13235 [Planctomycetes bacterium]|nr:hypothetical protein [Planctomycetota bacterium]
MSWIALKQHEQAFTGKLPSAMGDIRARQLQHHGWWQLRWRSRRRFHGRAAIQPGKEGAQGDHQPSPENARALNMPRAHMFRILHPIVIHHAHLQPEKTIAFKRNGRARRMTRKKPQMLV